MLTAALKDAAHAGKVSRRSFMNELRSTVDHYLRKQGSDEDTQRLWQQLFNAFRDGGIDSVENMLEELVELPEEE
ncbi:MAG: hypothetical protein HXY18_14375 [Bryobacteraceae bacterium]|nr:hypothetical protein [Bryobacteraceae bacterium]